MALRKSELLAYTEKAVSILVERGHFVNGDAFRVTQRDALIAYQAHLRNPLLPIDERLGYTFELSMALGKTAIYLGIFEEIYKLAKADGVRITGGVVVPLVSIFDGIEDEIKKYAPSVAARTNYYGAGHKETDGDFGVYIYPTFIDLVKKGAIKLDVLFSDEAHRGTSVNRAETYISKFLGKIVSIGLTATGAFDREKTIQKTHGKHGFKRSSADSIRLGELAEYAQAQLHVIRVAPQPLQQEITNDQERSRRNIALARKAWTATTCAILETGRDEHTGDPLSDNISAFYCADIDHITDTADALNASQVLREKAKAMGYAGVAVAIHSEMRRSERKAAKRGFDEGRYMAVVSDGVIKEGYNNARIKNIFDYPRGSIVEKAQIIGRALRKLWNATKSRWEGATIIDTVVYHGDPDIIKDQIVREGTILSVVTAWQVLSDTVVYGPGAEQSKKSKVGTPLPPIDIEGVTVDSFTTIESIHIIRAGIEQQIEERIQLDDCDPVTGKSSRDRYLFEYARAGLSIVRVMARIVAWAEQKNSLLPPELDTVKLRNWLSGTLSASKSEFDFVMVALESCEETWIQMNDINPASGCTYEQDFQSQYERMGRSIKAITDHIDRWAAERNQLVPKEINYTLLTTYVQRPRSVRKDLYDYIMEALVDAQPIVARTLVKLDEIDPELGITPRDAFLIHYARTGRSPMLILQHVTQWAIAQGRELPKGLTERMIAKWPRIVASANSEIFNFVMEALPSASISVVTRISRIELDERDPVIGRTPRELFLDEYQRTGSSAKLMHEFLVQWSIKNNKPFPDDLTLNGIKSWVRKTQTASKVAFEYVMAALKDAPTVPLASIPWLKLDDLHDKTGKTLRQFFVERYEKIGRSPRTILDRIAELAPEGEDIAPGLTAVMISSWPERAQTARKDLFDLVISVLDEQGARKPNQSALKSRGNGRRAGNPRNKIG